MNRLLRRAAPWVLTGATFIVGACSHAELDPTVVFTHEVRPAQPWVATGDLVDSGQICPRGDREVTAIAHADGTPMGFEELLPLIEAAMSVGGTHWDVPRVSWTEYVCYDGSGTIEVFTEMDGVSDHETLEILGGTGAYSDFAGVCILEEGEPVAGEIMEVTTTCEFDFRPDG